MAIKKPMGRRKFTYFTFETPKNKYPAERIMAGQIYEHGKASNEKQRRVLKEYSDSEGTHPTRKGAQKKMREGKVGSLGTIQFSAVPKYQARALIDELENNLADENAPKQTIELAEKAKSIIYIDKIHVIQKKQGYGPNLVRKLIEFAKERGADVVMVTTIGEDREGARLFEKMGFIKMVSASSEKPVFGYKNVYWAYLTNVRPPQSKT